MPGHNHYSWCMCGWCYKSRSNGYSARKIVFDHDKSYAKHKLKEYGADKRWTACFVVPNASCPDCFAKVYYYQNVHGSSVFFDELGWPWPKHPCTDNSKQTSRLRGGTAEPIVMRTRGTVGELLEAAMIAEFDPNAKFRTEYGHSPVDLFTVVEVHKGGFEIFIKATSISPPLEDPVFVSFNSASVVPLIGDYFSFDGNKASFVDPKTLVPKKYKAKAISPEAFSSATPKSRS